ncbi:MAG: TrmH family RNA methyltransferase [Bradymonadia bacterium]
MITSSTNPRVKSVVRLQQKAAERRTTGTFCVETPRTLERALTAGLTVDTIYFDPDDAPPMHLMERALASGARAMEVKRSVLEKMAYRNHPEGFVAVIRGRSTTLEDLGEVGWCVVCSNVEKPGNLGAILRTADGAGASAVLVDQPGFDLYNPNCIRASTGAVFSMPVICDTAAHLRTWLSDRKMRCVAATPEADQLYTEADLGGPVALVLGAEAEGLDADWKAVAAPVRLPMHGLADSLNVSVTAGILMYETLRQRSVR